MTCRFIGCNKVYTLKSEVRRVKINLIPNLANYAK